MDAVEVLDGIVKKYNVPKELLHVEITESALMDDTNLLHDAVKRLHEKGYAIGVLSNKQAPVLEKLAESILIPGSYDAVQGVFPGAAVKPDPFLSKLICNSQKYIYRFD